MDSKMENANLQTANRDPVSKAAQGIGTRYNAGEQIGDGKMLSPAFNSNCAPILAVLQKYIRPDSTAKVMEVASGSGMHVVYFAAALSTAQFLPTAYEQQECTSIIAHIKESGLTNILPPIRVDASADFKAWGVESSGVDVIININMVHISPWRVCQGFMAGAAAALKKDGRIFMYGPYNTANAKMSPGPLLDGKYTSEGNKKFDASLRGRDSSWGIRLIEDVVAEAETNGLKLEAYHHMPANNFTLVFVKMQ